MTVGHGSTRLNSLIISLTCQLTLIPYFIVMHFQKHEHTRMESTLCTNSTECALFLAITKAKNLFDTKSHPYSLVHRGRGYFCTPDRKTKTGALYLIHDKTVHLYKETAEWNLFLEDALLPP